jgi:hypothetical protein
LVAEVVAKEASDPKWTIGMADYKKLYNFLFVNLRGYSKTENHTFKQPEDGTYYTSKLLETDLEYAIGQLQIIIYKAKNRGYAASESF